MNGLQAFRRSGGGTDEETPASCSRAVGGRRTGTVEKCGRAGAADAGVWERAVLRELPGRQQLRMPPERSVRGRRGRYAGRRDVNIPDEDVPLDDGEDLRDLETSTLPLADLISSGVWDIPA